MAALNSKLFEYLWMELLTGTWEVHGDDHGDTVEILPGGQADVARCRAIWKIDISPGDWEWQHESIVTRGWVQAKE